MSNLIDEFVELIVFLCLVVVENGVVVIFIDIVLLVEIGYNVISIVLGLILLCFEELFNKFFCEVGELDIFDVECNVEEDKFLNGVRIVNFEEMSREE